MRWPPFQSPRPPPLAHRALARGARGGPVDELPGQGLGGASGVVGGEGLAVGVVGVGRLQVALAGSAVGRVRGGRRPGGEQQGGGARAAQGREKCGHGGVPLAEGEFAGQAQ
ncbi:hypothetical protein GCM10020220_088070 [Nonomuraea rubra]|uniref:hypothetical protein n=1 Tax=Nonomuraea rubra TaxID=46180 RepID=UPI0031E7FD91